MWRERTVHTPVRVRDLVQASAPFNPSYHDDEPVLLQRVADDISGDDVCGEWIGLAKLSARGSELLRAEIEAMREDGSLNLASLPDLFTRLAGRDNPPRVVYVTGHWLDVNDAFDLAKAGDFT
jgi:phosphoenolpyruvate phosphomutase